jgi:hypothetical protein
MQEQTNSFIVSQVEAKMKKFLRISDIVNLTLTLALAMAFTVAGNRLTIAAGPNRPSCSLNQILKGNKNADPGCVKPNVGWNS